MDDSCPSAVVSFYSFYLNHVHFYLCVAICIVGSVFNIINIIVFTRKNMISSTNFLLTRLAVADIVLLFSYIPGSFELSGQYVHKNSTLFPAIIYVARFISIWITLVLAIWRYLAIEHPLKARKWCNMKTTKRTMVAVYVLCLLVFSSFPLFNMTSINPGVWAFFFILCFSMIPAITMLTFTLGQVYALWKAKKSRQKLMPRSIQQNAGNLERENRLNRTTEMLLIVLFLFLMTMVPYDVILLEELVKRDFKLRSFFICIEEFYAFFEMLMILDAATNFVVYYFMSCQFRKTCHTLFNCNTFAAVQNLLRKKPNDERTAETTPV